MSPVFTFNACLNPSGQLAPYRTASTTSSITLGWQEPLDDGGCPVTGFAVFRDDGTQIAPAIEVNSASDAAVRAIPTLRALVVTSLPAGKEGQYVRFSVRAFNREGSVDSSSYAAILFAAVPSKPPTVPQLVAAESNSTILTVLLTELTTLENGNSVV
jgi:hypothetical protein